MKQFTYSVDGNIKSTATQTIYNEAGVSIATVERTYSNGLKKVLDSYFDYRYFLTYIARDMQGDVQFTAKKIFRRGKVWFEGRDANGAKYIINYENWRIGVPELFITGNGVKLKIDKEMEGWSEFYADEVNVARWQAEYDEVADKFHMTLQIEETSPVQDIAFYAAIAQATLFIGV
ncbi:MAG: peptide ABC transporter ATPase [Solibacillus sp.]